MEGIDEGPPNRRGGAAESRSAHAWRHPQG